MSFESIAGQLAQIEDRMRSTLPPTALFEIVNAPLPPLQFHRELPGTCAESYAGLKQRLSDIEARRAVSLAVARELPAKMTKGFKYAHIEALKRSRAEIVESLQDEVEVRNDMDTFMSAIVMALEKLAASATANRASAEEEVFGKIIVECGFDDQAKQTMAATLVAVHPNVRAAQAYLDDVRAALAPLVAVNHIHEGKFTCPFTVNGERRMELEELIQVEAKKFIQDEGLGSVVRHSYQQGAAITEFIPTAHQ